MKTVDDVLNQWALTTALESSRLQLYLSHALRAARAGELEDARSVALTVAGHVTLDAPKLHLFLGMMALAVQEPLLLFEARAFLRLMHQDALFRQLDEAGERNKPDFDAVA